MGLYGLKVSMIPKVSFSWKLDGTAGQVSYTVFLRDEDGNNIWYSGLVKSPERHNIPCGAELKPCSGYSWKVAADLADGTTLEAEGRPFTTGIDTWKAKWVEPDRVRKPLTDSTTPIHGVIDQRNPFDVLDPAVDLRRTFTLDAVPEKAVLFSTARGIYNLYVNGTRVSDLFAPGVTSYPKRIEYQRADVKELLVPGKNVIAATLADGWYTGKIGAVGIGQQYGTENSLLFQLELLRDGKWESICSDEKVRTAESAWQYADLFVGAGYLESLKRDGWMQPDYD